MQVTLNHRSFHFKNRNSNVLFQLIADKFLSHITLEILLSVRAHITKAYLYILLRNKRNIFCDYRINGRFMLTVHPSGTDIIVVFAPKRVQVITLFRYCVAGPPFQRRNNNENTHNVT
jgi:hypothetical protein